MLQIKRLAAIVLLAALSTVLVISCSKDSDSSFTPSGEGGGKGGSMARFTITCNHLYAVDDAHLKVFSIADPSDPVLIRTIQIGSGIETIFPYHNNLFLGTTTGMLIYSLNDCSNPTYVSQFQHLLSCDPVVVQDDIAYVTLRSGGDCRTGWTTNQLDILDVTNINNPYLIQSHPVDEPYGLGIDGDYLFLCHGEFGFGVYDVSNPSQLITIDKYPTIDSYDVIPNNGHLLLTGPDGLYQFDYGIIDSIKQVSHIPIVP